MRTLYAILLVLLLCPPAYSQGLIIDSTRFITGNKPETSINFAIPTADKGILFAGSDYGNPGGIIPYFPIDTGVNGNAMIGKIDSNQKISWIKIYGGTDADGAGPSVQTLDGGYAVLCGTGSNDGDVTGFKGEEDLWLLRLDANGNLLWEKCYGSSANDGAASIANTPDHGFILLGISNGNDGDVPFHYGDASNFDWIVIKIDSMGNVQWSKDLGGTDDEGEGSILAIDSSYYLISNSGSRDHDCTDTAWHPNVPTGFDIYILKLNDTGKVLWDSSYGGTGSDGANFAFFDTRDSTIVVNGFTYSSNYMVTGYQGQGDLWVLKVDKNGKLIWTKTLGSPYEDYATGICPAYGSGYMAYGWTHNTGGSVGSENMWLFQLDDSGNEIYNKQFGANPGIEESSCSVLQYLNGYVATGTSYADTFTEGTTYGNFDGGGVFVTYIDTGNSKTLVDYINKSIYLMNVYPDPAQNGFIVCLPANIKGNLTVINSIGQIVYYSATTSDNVGIDIALWANGLYLVRWQSENGTVLTAKVIKN